MPMPRFRMYIKSEPGSMSPVNDFWNWVDQFGRLGRGRPKSPSDVVLMQSTNQHDKQGQEVCQGDVLDEFGGQENYVVKSLSDFWWRAGEWADVDQSTVIGNIYDNPELLDGSE